MADQVGRLAFSKGGFIPATDLEKGSAADDAKKLSPSIVLYFTPEQIGSDNGAACEHCLMFVSDTNKCVIVKTPSEFNKDWVCALLAPGDSITSADAPVLEDIFNADEVGLVNYRTSCGGVGSSKPCVAFIADSEDCKKVNARLTANGKIEAGGCCNGHNTGK